MADNIARVLLSRKLCGIFQHSHCLQGRQSICRALSDALAGGKGRRERAMTIARERGARVQGAVGATAIKARLRCLFYLEA